ncbi:MAG TPA: DUF6680 family protein [Bryobacteraceae bacterium]|jgi:hypothetical protein|nr:DUF6680 family protein [Bryobacteraceae bacterium]
MWANVVLPLLTIVAIIVGPIAALYIQRKLDRERAARDRKLHVFRTLMTYRASRLSAPFVEALNAIEVEFYAEKDKKAKRVVEFWREYCDQLFNPDFNDPAKLSQAVDKSTELLNDLLSEMGAYLGYRFEKGILRRNVYNPRGWAETENEQQLLRKAAVEVFGGKQPLRVKIEEDAVQPGISMPFSQPPAENAPPSGRPAGQGVLARAAKRSVLDQ